MNDITKKIIYATLISLVIFSIVALIIAGALSLGRGSPSGDSVDRPSDVKNKGETFNLLLIMTDYLPEKYSDYDPLHVKNVFGIDADAPTGAAGLSGYRKIHTEDMALLMFDSVSKEIRVTPIPGDTLVSVKGIKTKMENLAYTYGIEFLVSKIHAFTGIKIDKYAVFTPESGAEAFDLIGQVTYTLKFDMNSVDDSRGIDISIKSGSQKFDGKKAVDLLRFDEYGNTNITRADVLSGFLKRVIKKTTDSFTHEEIYDIISSVSESIYGDCELSYDQIKLICNLDKLELKIFELSGEEQIIGGEKYFIPDEGKILELFKPYREIYS